MKQTFRSNQEVCHIWASRSQEYGVCGSIYFRGDTIYSYGSHFPMAKFIGDDVVLVTTLKHSSTTSCHQGLVSQAIPPSYKQYHVDTVMGDRLQHVMYYAARLESTYKKFPRARTNSHRYYERNHQIMDEMLDYAERFRCKSKLPNYSRFVLASPENKETADMQREVFTAKQKQIRKTKAAEIKKAKAKNAKMEQLWLSGVMTQGVKFSEVRVRVNPLDPKELNTSSGAYVPLREAKTLYRLIKRNKPVQGIKIGSYTVTGINGTLRVGCHEISRTEIDRFATVMNW